MKEEKNFDIFGDFQNMTQKNTWHGTLIMYLCKYKKKKELKRSLFRTSIVRVRLCDYYEMAE